LWRDDGNNGDFYSLYFIDSILGLGFTDLMVEKAVSYRYMYRARNINGWGEFSNIGYLYAASVPGKPFAPAMTFVDSTSITLKMFAPADSGGADILEYELFVNGGEINTGFTKVTTYSDAGGDSASLLTHTLTADDDGLVTGKI